MAVMTERIDADGPRLEVGDRAPGFSLLDQTGSTVSLDDYSGERVIVYFYPEADTPACTTQACDFRDSLDALAASGYRVVGISRDPVAKLARFVAGQHLTFPVLSDPELVAHRAWGVWGEKNSYGRLIVGVRRSTFVVGTDGTLEHAAYNVRATGHVASLRKKLGVA